MKIVSIFGKFLKSHVTIVVTAFYIFATFFYMGPSISNCNSTLYGFGDNTAGPIWRTSLSPEQPIFGGYEDSTNYPVGENVYNPTVYSLAGQTVLIWGSSQIFGPVCGYNVVNMVGFVFSALSMYFFIFWLLRSRWIAVLAGFAASFSPYFQVKVGGHPGYGYQGLLVLAIWSLFWLLKQPTKKRAIISGATIATSFYFDPYLSLLVMTCIAPIVLMWMVLRRPKDKKSSKQFKHTFKHLALALLTLIVCLLPLITVFQKNKDTITGSVSALRGNVLFEARACSNLPHEYALPFVLHPVMKRVFGDQYVKMINTWHEGFSCGIGEDTVGVSLALLSIVGMGTIIVFWEKINKRKLGFKLTYDPKVVIVGLSFMVLFAVIMALPPVKIQGVPTPSYVLLHLTSTWRTLARFYVVVNIGIVALSAVYMSLVARKFASNKKVMTILFILISAILIFEYQTANPFSGSVLSTFSYKKDVPRIYTQVRDDPSIRVVAEYPLERAGGESNATAYYLSMQVYHKKKLFNANDPLVKEEKYKASLKDISDLQTISVLKSIGVDSVIIHGLSEAQVRAIRGLEVIYVAPQSPFNILAYTPTVKEDITVVARIKDTTPTVDSMISLGDGFVRNTNLIKSAGDWSYEGINGAELNITHLPGAPEDQSKTNKELQNRCFYIAHTGDPSKVDYLNITADGKAVAPIIITENYNRIVVPANNTIKLENTAGYNLRIKDLGCN